MCCIAKSAYRILLVDINVKSSLLINLRIYNLEFVRVAIDAVPDYPRYNQNHLRPRHNKNLWCPIHLTNMKRKIVG